MLPEIRNRFDANISRVRNLVALYNQHRAHNGGGRTPVNSCDILRAATVFLHATLEEFLRAISRWKLPQADAAPLNYIPLLGYERAEKFSLGSLASHRGKTVDVLISESVEKFLEHTSYNDTTEISRLLRTIGVDCQHVNELFPALSDLIQRRHLIVHTGDRQIQPGRGHHHAKSISVRQVNGWIGVVVDFAARVSNQLEQ